MVQTNKKIALLHRYPKDRIKETNAAFPYLIYNDKMDFDYRPGAVNYWPQYRMDILTFKKFDRLSGWKKHLKSLLWIIYAPMLVVSKRYDVIYCDDSYPFYPAIVKMVSPRSKVVLRIGDFHLMYYFSGLAYKVLHFFERISWIMADEIITISEAMADHIEAEIGRRPKVVLDPVDPKDFTLKPLYDDGSVMFHGTLTRNKNVDVLLECARLLPDVDFIVIGDGPDLPRLKSLAPFNVFFDGWIPFHKIHERIATCSVGVALRSENPGNKYVVTSPFLQYGIMGKPCLVTRRKVFGDYKWQFTGAEEMAEKLKVLLMTPWEEGQKLREYILENHNVEKIAEEIWAILLSQ